MLVLLDKKCIFDFFTLEQSLWSKEQIVEGGTTGKMPITLFDQKINVRQKLNPCLDNFSEIISEGASRFLSQLGGTPSIKLETTISISSYIHMYVW